jgi:geranylgeranyl reductase family protein
METYDIAVVGGGPIGCFVAQQLASKGMHVAIFEEHSTIGQPVHCAGLVTQRVFDISHCSRIGIIQNTIYGAHIHSPSGSILTIGGDKTHALVIDRQRFDETLADDARHAGAELKLEHKVTIARHQESSISLSVQHQNTTYDAHCTILIGADGPYSHIRKAFKFPHPIELLHGVGAELIDTVLNPKFVHIFVGHQIAPGFFAWVIPTNPQGTTARLGLCIKKQTARPLNQYFTTLLQHPLLQGAKVLQKYGGSIPLGPLKKTVTDHVMLVGDAAAQVKPTSGGGIYPGLLCSTYCASIAERAVQDHRYDERSLRYYHIQWTKEIGRELSLGMRFRKLFTNFTDVQLNKYLEKLQNPKTIDAINTYGDIDYPSRLAFPLLRTSPSLLSLAPSLLKRTRL